MWTTTIGTFLKQRKNIKDANSFYSLTNEASQMGEAVLLAVNEVTNSINEIAQTIGQSAQGASSIAKGTDERPNLW